MEAKKCINCGKEFSSRAWNARSCSGSCSLKQWRREHPEHNRQIKINWRRKNGILERGSIECNKKISELTKLNTPRGEKHFRWKGDDVSYRSLHKWVERYLGKPIRCEFADENCSHSYDWSNISGKYKRDFSDWRRLCHLHHMRHDAQRRKQSANNR